MVTTDLIQITKDFWLYLRPLPREIIHVWERKPDRWELQGPSRASVANMLLKFCYPDVSNWPLCIIYNLHHCSFQPCQKASPLEWTAVPNWPVLWEKITVESLSLNVSPLYKGSGNIDKAWEKKKISVLEDEDECRESFLSEHDVTTAVITFTLLAAVFPSTKSTQGQAYQHSSRDRRGVYKAPTQSEELLAFNRS